MLLLGSFFLQTLVPQEGQQIRVDLVLMSCCKTVRTILVINLGSVFCCDYAHVLLPFLLACLLFDRLMLLPEATMEQFGELQTIGRPRVRRPSLEMLTMRATLTLGKLVPQLG